MKRPLLSMAVLCAAAIGAIGSARADTNDACNVAGTLKEVVGSVAMDRGAGFTPAVIGASLKTGDKVAVQGPGSAVIDFGDGKTITVPGSTTEVLRVPGCGFASGYDPTVVILGTAVVGGGIAAAIALSDSGSSAPFFPISP